jgi:hypothetical protein
MALSAVEFMRTPELVRQAQAEFKKSRLASKYVSPIPDGLKPPLNI